MQNMLWLVSFNMGMLVNIWIVDFFSPVNKYILLFINSKGYTPENEGHLQNHSSSIYERLQHEEQQFEEQKGWKIYTRLTNILWHICPRISETIYFIGGLALT